MSVPGRPKGEYRSAQHEGGPGRSPVQAALPPSRAGLRLLVSVRDREEALIAAHAGVDLIDLKEPSLGALGGLSTPVVAALVRAVRAATRGERWRPLSATVGDWVAGQGVEVLLERVTATGATGVDWVKVGIEPAMPQPQAVLAALAMLPAPVVPVLIVDQGLDLALLRAAAEAFPMLMLDTADKHHGSLLERLPSATLRSAVTTARAAGAKIGLAGALRVSDLPALQALGPDFAGFRSAVCDGDRRGRLDAARLATLQAALRALAPDGRAGSSAPSQKV